MPPFTITPVGVPNACALPACSVPLSTVTVPVWVFAALNVHVPAPLPMRLPAPEITPENVLMPPKVPPSVSWSTGLPATNDRSPLSVSAPVPSFRMDAAPWGIQVRSVVVPAPV